MFSTHAPQSKYSHTCILATFARVSYSVEVFKDPTADFEPVFVANAWSNPESQPGRGAGWLGCGAPLKVRQNYHIRQFEDGAGLCSPGRWPPHRRRLPAVGDLALQLVSAMGLNLDDWSNTIFAMLAGKLKSSPFKPEEVAKGREFLTSWVTEAGFPPTPTKKDIQQGPQIRLLQAFMRACADPDAEAMDCFATGVCLGYNQRMPRTPAVYEAKAKWRLKFEESQDATEEWSPNHGSARLRQEFLGEKIEADFKTGRMVAMTYKEARERFGSRLLLGAMGIIEEGKEKFRLIHDGTHRVLINNRIRTRDHVPGPLVADIAGEMADTEKEGTPHIG